MTMTKIDNDSMLAWALRYAELGWRVFPLRTSGDLKRPHQCLGGKDEGGHHKATTDPAQIRAWWTAYPTAGIGVDLAGSGLISVDVDPKDGGPAKLRALEAIHGRLNTPVQAITGSSGRHYLYLALEGIQPPGKLNNEVGIDLKYNGYIVLAPSPHSAGKPPTPTGKRYAWAPGMDPFDNAFLMPPMPLWFLNRPGKALQLGSPDSDDVFASDTQKAGLSLEQIKGYLELVPNDDSTDDIDYETWFNVLAGIWHETDGSAEGEEIAEEWSAQSSKHDAAKFNRTWPSLNPEGSGRAPITIRVLIKLAQAAKSLQAIEAFKETVAKFERAGSVPEWKAVCAEVKRLEFDAIDRSLLANEVRKAHKRITGNAMTATKAERAIKFEHSLARGYPEWLENWVYISSEESFLRLGSNLAITKSSFDNTYNRHMLTRQERAEGKGYPELTASNAALNTYQIPRAERRMYLPGEDQSFTMNGVTYFNTFSSASQPEAPDVLTPRDQAAIRRLESHFEHMVPVARDRAIFISWLAYIVQEQRRPNWSIVFQSPEAEGKTFFAELMGAVLGAENVKTLDPKLIKGGFTGWAAGDLLKVVEEIKLHGSERFEILDNMKAFITNNVINVRALHREAVDVVNTAAYLMFTNYRDALPLLAGDTRYFLLASPRQTAEVVADFKAKNPTYFTRLFGMVSESPGALRRFFLNYELSPDFNPTGRAPQSDEKDYVVRLNKTDQQADIEDLIGDRSDPCLSEVLFNTTLMANVVSDEGGQFLQKRAVGNTMSRLGFTYLGRFKIGESNQRFWSRQPKRFVGKTDHHTRANIVAYMQQYSTDDL